MRILIALIVFVIFVISGNAIAATAQVNAINNLGGAVNASGVVVPIGDVPNIITIGAGGNVATNNKMQFYKWASNGNAQYQVTAGKTFYAYGFFGSCGTSQSLLIMFGYDTATFTNNSAVTGTDIYFGFGNTAAGGTGINATTESKWYPISMAFPANSYPFVLHNCSTSDAKFQLVGKEI